MLLFCPNCANTLAVAKGSMMENKWACATCPYEYPIDAALIHRRYLPRKQVDDVMGGAESWANVDTAVVICPKCENDKAYFMQIQIRSADEPSMFMRPRLCHALTGLPQ